LIFSIRSWKSAAEIDNLVAAPTAIVRCAENVWIASASCLQLFEGKSLLKIKTIDLSAEMSNMKSALGNPIAAVRKISALTVIGDHVFAAADNSLKIIHAASCQVMVSTEGFHVGSITSLCAVFYSDENVWRVWSASADKCICIWDVFESQSSENSVPKLRKKVSNVALARTSHLNLKQHTIVSPNASK